MELFWFPVKIKFLNKVRCSSLNHSLYLGPFSSFLYSARTPSPQLLRVLPPILLIYSTLKKEKKKKNLSAVGNPAFFPAPNVDFPGDTFWRTPRHFILVWDTCGWRDGAGTVTVLLRYRCILSKKRTVKPAKWSRPSVLFNVPKLANDWINDCSQGYKLSKNISFLICISPLSIDADEVDAAIMTSLLFGTNAQSIFSIICWSRKINFRIIKICETQRNMIIVAEFFSLPAL